MRLRGGAQMLLSHSCARIGLILAVSCCVANALEIKVTGIKNWIWFKENGSDNPIQTPMEKVEATNDSVSLSGNKYYTSTSSFIDSVIVDGTTSKAVIQTNKSFTIGTLTLKGSTSMAVAGSYVDSNCADSLQCAVFNVNNLVLKSAKDKEILLRRVSAKNTTIKGDGTINIGTKGTGKAENHTNLGNVVVKKGSGTNGVTIKSASDATAGANSITIESGAKLTFDTTNGNTGKINVETIDIKNGAEIDKQNGTNGELKITNIIAEAGAKGLDKVTATNLTITTIKSGSIAEFFSTTPTITDLGTTLTGGKAEGATITHNSVDNGTLKYSGDIATIIAKDNGNYKASTGTTNLKVQASDRLQASLDNAYLAHHILLSNIMKINNKLFLFDNFQGNNKEYTDKQFKNHEVSDNESKNYIDSWVDYEYDYIDGYGEALKANTHAVQLGVGLLRTNSIKVGGFFRYTYLGAKNENINNTYATHAYNVGLYGAANVWTNGFLRGHFAYTHIGSKGNYSLRNDKTDTNTSGAIKDSFHYLTTSVGVAQEGVIENRFWGSIALDVAHTVPLIEDSQFGEYNFSKNSVTLATLSGAFGVKVLDTILYAAGQVGYAISSRDSEIDLRQRAQSDFYAGGTAQNGSNTQWQSDFGSISDYKYNMIVGDLGIGATYNFTKAFKGNLYIGAGFYSGSKPHLKLNAGLSYLF